MAGVRNSRAAANPFQSTRASRRAGRSQHLLTKAVIETLEKRTLLSGYVVTSTADDGSSGTLRWAIQQANTAGGNQTITFASSLTSSAPATIDLNGSPLEISGNITINGPGQNLLAIDGGGKSNIFTVDSGSTAEIENLTVKDGYIDGYGGGIINMGDLTVSDSTITQNLASDSGGGLYAESGTLTIDHSTISDNGTVSTSASYNSGGGIYSLAATAVIITDSIISGNAAHNGGGVYSHGTLAVNDSMISGNSAYDGGGLSISGQTSIGENSQISHNNGTVGGGIYTTSTNATITDSTLIGNEADTGGAIYSSSPNFGANVSDLGKMTVSGTALEGNATYGKDAGQDFIYTGGGAICNVAGATLTITNNSTISGNNSQGFPGAGIASYGSTLNVTDSTITGNSQGSDGGGIYNSP